MLWMIFAALLANGLVPVVASMRGLDVDRATGTRLLTSSFFLVLAFIAVSTAAFFHIHDAPVNWQPGPPGFAQIDGVNTPLGALGAVAGGIGLFVMVLACVHLAQSQPRLKLPAFDDDAEKEPIDDGDVTSPGERFGE